MHIICNYLSLIYVVMAGQQINNIEEEGVPADNALCASSVDAITGTNVSCGDAFKGVCSPIEDVEKFKTTKRNKQKKFEPYWYRKKTPGLVSDSDLDKILTRGHKETMKLWSHLKEAKMQNVECNIVKK